MKHDFKYSMAILKPLMFFVLLLSATGLSAQKFGHINYGNLLASLPEIKSAEAQLKSFQEPLLAKIESNYKAFQTKYEEALKKIQSGELSPVQQQQKEQELGQEQQRIAKMEQDIQQQIMKKREELLTPILIKIETALTDVGKEGGYAYIFDTSKGQLLYAEQSEDVTAKVMAKLGK